VPFDVKWPPEALGSRMNANCNTYERFSTRINVDRQFVIDCQNNVTTIRTSIIIGANHFVILICVREKQLDMGRVRNSNKYQPLISH
jgi:hypothetical protein